MAELTDEPDGYLEHTPLGDFLAYSKTGNNPQTPLYSLEKARAILALSATEAEDAARMDWLESMTVNVRVPLRYGSRNLFWASPDDEDGHIEPSDLRKQIDAARTQSNVAAGGGR